jgi:hypothetical protein
VDIEVDVEAFADNDESALVLVLEAVAEFSPVTVLEFELAVTTVEETLPQFLLG